MLFPFFLSGWGEVEIFSFEKGFGYILSLEVIFLEHKSNLFSSSNLHLLSIWIKLIFSGYNRLQHSPMRV